MWVAKVGGSLHANPRLSAWLTAVREDRERRWLLVPGGGPHADAVRAEQRAVGYDDAEAHLRAMLAMARYGEELSGRVRGLERAASLADCLTWARSRRAAPCLWCPSRGDVAAFADLPADWRVSSDSLAHALATRVGAAALLLVKSAPPPRAARAAALATAGWIDPWLPRLMGASPLPVYWDFLRADGELSPPGRPAGTRRLWA